MSDCQAPQKTAPILPKGVGTAIICIAILFVALVIGLVFVALKSFDQLTWSWWWVTSPLWGGLTLFNTAVVGGAVHSAITNARSKQVPPPPAAAAPGLKAVPNTSTGKQPS